MTTDAALYREFRTELIALARDRRDELERLAPATPAWRVRDVLAHLGGVCDDVVHGNLAQVGGDSWTEAQVEQRRAWAVDEVLDDWEAQGRAVEALMDQAPAGMFGQLLFDAWTHGQDVRGALGVPGGRSSTIAGRSYEWGVEAMKRRDDEGGRTRLSLVTDVGVCIVGVAEPAASLRASRYELLRAMTGRRSRAQICAYGWDGPPDPERLLLADFFRPPATDLVE